MGKPHCLEEPSVAEEATQDEVRAAIEEAETVTAEPSKRSNTVSEPLEAVVRCVTDRRYRREVIRRVCPSK
ncbi:hypothetical protein OB955_19720 [Halobacteria archaeon AArc-m2/3/4]|uniref:Uncharacterized protein n=1 Tax=Natronoglomus mannanivorans TaxID=2979990 RepID=A0AAP3E4Z4_9EURY|nr:hypothetical protein [Halobacteria archaeon AArc-xg1-1]MCU4974952.1 hypothetical protein [Halobacteria archaeon AArc-m2/3/4]